VVLEFHDEVLLAILDGDEVLDGVQEETAKTMACSNRSFASWNSEERWLEVSGTAMLCRASTNMGDVDESRRLRPYQKVQIDEADLMAK
jgi:hypothetical protein